jgi:hypothetical protein
MTFSEFRWWLRGFSEHISEAPTFAEWEHVLTMLDGVEEAPPRRMVVLSPPEYVSQNETQVAKNKRDGLEPLR